MHIDHICFITEGYPTENDPFFTFVKQLVCAFADMGIKCSVISPQSISNAIVRKKDLRPFHWVDLSKNNNKINIYQPKYISFSNNKTFKNLKHNIWMHSIIRTFEKIKINPSIIYGHFWQAGAVASIIGKKNKLPVFVATGESRISVDKNMKKNLKNINGAICVSKKNMDESLSLGITEKEKMIIVPNAIDNELFYLENKEEVRKKLDLSNDNFIVAFTGAFNERKGVLRLLEAAHKVSNVRLILIGSGQQRPEGDNIIFCGKLPHNQIVHYLNASDIFVLPTLAEGCSNAIIEAMACGLPIISSDLPFNDDILNEKNSIRIDSNDIESIANAIKHLKENTQICESMSKESLLIASNLNIDRRAEIIIEFIKSKI